jgi:uncharacterized lipoprotein NlpE involved in copper resistance
MKKLFTLVAVASMFTFVACGPSAEELAAKAKATADSIAAVNEQQAAAEAAKMQATNDSIAKADAAAKAAKDMQDSIDNAAKTPAKPMKKAKK